MNNPFKKKPIDMNIVKSHPDIVMQTCSPKSSEFFNTKFKALAIGGVWYLNRKCNILKAKDPLLVDTYQDEKFKKAYNKTLDEMGWNPTYKWLMSMACNVFITFLKVDNAYKQFWDKFIINYNEEMKNG